ncbi:hypothetical protein J7T55_009319 [Diaporthe amygdali]|uniref:uncharacterized protein n=1 Tax=Phomopsis amygdali TaxID=1214568 RepID=UPI0022FDC265|nr:uncharacterized protein J7T55_009319 [Diaporthe amygdali]KAJ0100727.1 hypothetical protein J7T55_009319 [Diaporthe amygdali]
MIRVFCPKVDDDNHASEADTSNDNTREAHLIDSQYERRLKGRGCRGCRGCRHCAEECVEEDRSKFAGGVQASPAILWSLTDRLKTMTQDPTLSLLITKIRPSGHATVRLYSGQEAASTKSPDGQLRFLGTASPQFVLEVGYSQKATSLSQLAKDHFENSDGAIKIVLTININYAKSRERHSNARVGAHSATFCLYRGPERIHHSTVFRDAQRQRLADVSLRPLLADFIPEDVLEELDPQLRHEVEQVALDLPSKCSCQVKVPSRAVPSEMLCRISGSR